jgi:hypothetical protein
VLRVCSGCPYPKIEVVRTVQNSHVTERNFNLDLDIALSNIDWDNDDPNRLWENFKTTFNYVADVHAPTKSRRVRIQKAPWLTDEIKKNINRGDFLKKKAIQSNSSAYHNAYKSLRNKINKQIIDAKRLYYTDCIDRNKNNTKQMWKNINHLINKKSKSTNISSLQIDDQVIIESWSMSSIFNENFTDIGPTLSRQFRKLMSALSAYVTKMFFDIW